MRQVFWLFLILQLPLTQVRWAGAAAFHGPTNVFATQVADYAQGTVASYDTGYNDTIDWTGIPAGTTGAYEGFPGVVTPFFPPFDPNQILVFGIGGHLSVQFPNPVTVTSGSLFGVFSTCGFTDSTGNGTVGKSAATFGGGLTTVSVSEDGTNWFSLGVKDIDVPQNYYQNAGPYDVIPPSQPVLASYGKPYTGSLSAFANESDAQVIATLNGSAGGTWIDAGDAGLTEIDYVDFAPPATAPAGWQIAIQAVSTATPQLVPEPCGLLAVVCAFVLFIRQSKKRISNEESHRDTAPRPSLVAPDYMYFSKPRTNASRPNAYATGSAIGFTLVELLVVIGIISVLVSLLLPTLSAARQQAKSVRCLSNLHQMTVAAELYCDTAHGSYPLSSFSSYIAPVSSNFSWDYTIVTNVTTGTRTLYPGLLWLQGIYSVQSCPSFDGPSNTVVTVPYTGYDYNASYIGGLPPGPGQTASPCPPMKASQIRQPSRCALFGDGQYYAGAQAYMRSPFPGPVDIALSFNSPSAGTQGFRHRGKTNVAYCDGHAQSIAARFTQYNPLDTHPLGTITGFLSADNSAYGQ